ncbi:MAG: formylmethanofuran dehydrogenase subunit E family protein [bacterium]
MKYPRIEPLSYAEAIRFHGHEGPFLALGYRFGSFLLDEFKSESIKGIAVHISIPLRTPYSCFIDGVQCSACTTMGKRNLSAEEAGEEAISARVSRGDETANYVMTAKAIGICRNSPDMVTAIKAVFDSSPDDLWERVN